MSRLDSSSSFGIGSNLQHPGCQDSWAIQSWQGIWRPQAQPCNCVVGGHQDPGVGDVAKVQRAWQSQSQTEGVFALCQTASSGTSKNPCVTTPGPRHPSSPSLVIFPLWDNGQTHPFLPKSPFLHLLNGDSSRCLFFKIIVGNKQDRN